MTEPNFISTSAFARRMGWHRETVRRHIASGELPAIKVGRQWRVPVAALERALERADDDRAERAACNANNTEHEEP